MCQYGVSVAGFDKFECCTAIISGNRLVSEPNDRSVWIARQLLGRGKDTYDWLQAFLDKRRFGPLSEGVAVYVSKFRKLGEWQAEAAAHPLRRDEISLPDVCEQSCQH